VIVEVTDTISSDEHPQAEAMDAALVRPVWVHRHAPSGCKRLSRRRPDVPTIHRQLNAAALGAESSRRAGQAGQLPGNPARQDAAARSD